MRQWFVDNGPWVAPLIAVVLAVIGWRIQFVLRKRGGASIRQHQRGGDHSSNIQVAGDLRHGESRE